MYTSWICVDLNLGICYKNAKVVHTAMHVPLTEQPGHVYQRCKISHILQTHTVCQPVQFYTGTWLWCVPGPGLSYAVLWYTAWNLITLLWLLDSLSGEARIPKWDLVHRLCGHCMCQFMSIVDQTWNWVKLKSVRTLLRITCLADRKSYVIIICASSCQKLTKSEIGSSWSPFEHCSESLLYPTGSHMWSYMWQFMWKVDQKWIGSSCSSESLV